ncbi:MAG: hypothetical protein MK085_13825, partial [Phycisphaerales bacterium]|nr:hypothetical protein [Phycisphaerales bacterium]
DQAASAVGMGLISEDVVGATLGTSGVMFAASDQWRTTPDGSLHAFCHAVPGRWHLMGVMLSAAGSIQWFRDNIAPDIAEAVMALRNSTPAQPPRRQARRASSSCRISAANAPRIPTPMPVAAGSA